MGNFLASVVFNRLSAHAPIAAILLLVVGCNMTGSWRTVSVDPSDAEFPISRLTLNADHRFTATGPIEGETRTRFGTYRMGMASLHLDPVHGEKETYGMSARANGTYQLIWRGSPDKVSVTAVISRE